MHVRKGQINEDDCIEASPLVQMVRNAVDLKLTDQGLETRGWSLSVPYV